MAGWDLTSALFDSRSRAVYQFVKRCFQTLNQNSVGDLCLPTSPGSPAMTDMAVLEGGHVRLRVEDTQLAFNRLV